MLDMIPSGVLVDRGGNIKVLFSLLHPPIEYKISKTQLSEYLNICKTSQALPDPSTPTVLSNSITQSSMILEWSHPAVLPFPIGIIQMTEVQYSIATDEEGCEIIEKALRWTSMSCKHYYRHNFLREVLSNQLPGTSFRFRIRYSTLTTFQTSSNQTGTAAAAAAAASIWSAFSPPSPLYRTLADLPCPPDSLQLTTITAYSANLTWDPCERCGHLLNGSPAIEEFILVGRSIGGEFTVLYRGLRSGYLATGLYPEFAYSFQLAVRTAAGQSDFGPPVSFHTPTRPKGRAGFLPSEVAAASSCRDAWIELWDPRADRVTYFNTLVAVRQPDLPDACKAADDAMDDAGGCEDDKKRGQTDKQAEKERETLFRVRRFKILRQLHQLRARGLQASSVGGSRSPASPGTGGKTRNEVAIVLAV